ncbi:hypothetical protein [Cellulosilyticum ruminicola]|uniref:hypothetical protein n=1 Tax=Cellulosilyticum ruminicola TaxID=425254 RepID=UPI0006D26C64|nr:hypothetical protein [Cellulosilyticum ruminicola]
MENKKYEDYQVLDGTEEEIIDIEIIEDTAQEYITENVQEGQLEETISEENILETNISEEALQEDGQRHAVISLNKPVQEVETEQIELSVVASQKSRRYKSVLMEDAEEENIKSDEQSFENNYSGANYASTENYKTENEYSSPIQEEEVHKDTSFSSYIETEKKKERSFLAKWTIRLVKLILFIMLLPVIGIVGGGMLGVLGGVSLGIVACIGGGLFIIAMICFLATQINATMIALGISVGIAAMSFGGIVLIIFMMMIKGIIGLVRRIRLNRRNKKEVR